MPEAAIYIYDIEANYNSVNYYVMYTGMTEDLTEFFNEFFQKNK